MPLFLDGKSFAEVEILIALGVTLDGHKIRFGLQHRPQEAPADPLVFGGACTKLPHRRFSRQKFPVTKVTRGACAVSTKDRDKYRMWDVHYSSDAPCRITMKS